MAVVGNDQPRPQPPLSDVTGPPTGPHRSQLQAASTNETLIARGIGDREQSPSARAESPAAHHTSSPLEAYPAGDHLLGSSLGSDPIFSISTDDGDATRRLSSSPLTSTSKSLRVESGNLTSSGQQGSCGTLESVGLLERELTEAYRREQDMPSPVAALSPWAGIWKLVSYADSIEPDKQVSSLEFAKAIYRIMWF